MSKFIAMDTRSNLDWDSSSRNQLGDHERDFNLLIEALSSAQDTACVSLSGMSMPLETAGSDLQQPLCFASRPLAPLTESAIADAKTAPVIPYAEIDQHPRQADTSSGGNLAFMDLATREIQEQQSRKLLMPSVDQHTQTISAGPSVATQQVIGDIDADTLAAASKVIDEILATSSTTTSTAAPFQAWPRNHTARLRGSAPQACLCDCKPQPNVLAQGKSTTIIAIDSKDSIRWAFDTDSTLNSLLTGACSPGDTQSQVKCRICGNSIRFSQVLVGEVSVGSWKRACREVQSSCWRQTSSYRSFQELVLMMRDPQGQYQLFEVVVSATSTTNDTDDTFLVARLKTLDIPAVATISARPVTTDAKLRSWGIHSSTHTFPNISDVKAKRAEMRLLVSRHGLILRISFPTPVTRSGSSTEAEALSAILGSQICTPRIGQSLVDIPGLASLLHIVAQAAVVGLAQTVHVSACGGRRIEVTIQPVLRTGPTSLVTSNQCQLPSAKVWVTLSADVISPTPPRRSSSSMAAFEFDSSSADFLGLTPQGSLHHGVVADTRAHLRPNRRASTSSLYLRAALAHASAERRHYLGAISSTYGGPEMAHLEGAPPEPLSIVVEDHLSMLVANLQDENRQLRHILRAALR